ncbi:DedA family protein [Cnuibacter sp. UC19_7]|uniref:DedA family protein n=1 Tax=Cnuibacter sp. UC19_7 TaxID=3350166 RepID=UPI00366D82CC
MTANAATANAVAAEGQELGGLVGLAAGVIDAIGEVGVGALTFAETVFPPLPSEVILPLAGFLSQTGRLDLVWVMVAATLGAYLGALLLYWLGAIVGEERSIRLLSKLPLVDRDDFEKASSWLSRHGRSSIFFGRLIPGVRSLISLPAGAQRMNLAVFSLFTLLGTVLWNGLLVGLGAALGTQYELIDQYSQWLDVAVYTAIGGVLVWLVVRRIRRGRAAATEQGDGA